MENISVDKQKLKQHHTNAAEFHKKAAENHYEAAKHHEPGNHEKGNSYLTLRTHPHNIPN